jgi:hypothetical protein
MARQREGDVGTYAFVDNVLDAIEETGRIAIELIPHIYDAPRQIRILGKKMEAKIVAVNQAWVQDDGQMVHIDLTVGKYDVTVSTGPSITTQRQETAELLTNALQAAPMLAPVILPRLASVIELPDADEFAEEVKQLLQPQQDGRSSRCRCRPRSCRWPSRRPRSQATGRGRRTPWPRRRRRVRQKAIPGLDSTSLKAAQLRKAEAEADEAQANAGIAYANWRKLANPWPPRRKPCRPWPRPTRPQRSAQPGAHQDRHPTCTTCDEAAGSGAFAGRPQGRSTRREPTPRPRAN